MLNRSWNWILLFLLHDIVWLFFSFFLHYCFTTLNTVLSLFLCLSCIQHWVRRGTEGGMEEETLIICWMYFLFLLYTLISTAWTENKRSRIITVSQLSSNNRTSFGGSFALKWKSTWSLLFLYNINEKMLFFFSLFMVTSDVLWSLNNLTLSF